MAACAKIEFTPYCLRRIRPQLLCSNRKASNKPNKKMKNSRIEAIGFRVIRYGLALVIAWIGFMKFTSYEANGIRPLVANSPLLGWAYHLLSVRQFSHALGVVEVGIATLIALRAWSPRACAIGSAAAVLMFLTTLSFLVSTPGWEPSLGGFPALSAHPGQFLLKDVVLVGAAVWSLGEALNARTRRLRPNRETHEAQEK
jgi:uncharacterized membrane protein YkgB